MKHVYINFVIIFSRTKCMPSTYVLSKTKVHFFHQHTSMTYFYGKDVICAILGKFFSLRNVCIQISRVFQNQYTNREREAPPL